MRQRGARLAGRILAMLLALMATTAPAADAIFAASFEAQPLAPMPLISRGKPVSASAGNAAALVDGTYFGGATWDVTPSAAAPSWVAIHVGSGPTWAALNWVAYPGSVLPASYRIETSANSSNGSNGDWTTAVTVTGNDVAARAHVFDFAGRQWVRLVVTAAQAPGLAISLDEIDVHDASAGSDDSWMFIGDSITAAAFSRSLYDGDFPERIHAVLPAYFPLMIGAGVGGTTTQDAVMQIDYWLARHPAMQNWIVSYGTNDSASGDPGYATAFGARLRLVVGKLRAAGKTVLIPRIPYKTGGEAYLAPYNAEVDAVTAEFGLDPGPDLYAWFLAHPEQLYDGVHPNDTGARAMNQLWATAVRGLYP